MKRIFFIYTRRNKVEYQDFKQKGIYKNDQKTRYKRTKNKTQNTYPIKAW